MPGITNACSPPPRRAPDLSSAPHLSSTAPRHCAPRNCAPRTSRRPCSAASLKYKLRAPHRGTSLGPFVCGARAGSLCSYGSIAFALFAAPTLIHPFISYLPDGLFVLTMPSDQPNRAAQHLAARLKRRLRLKTITMPRSPLQLWIAGWLFGHSMTTAKANTLTVKMQFLVCDGA